MGRCFDPLGVFDFLNPFFTCKSFGCAVVDIGAAGVDGAYEPESKHAAVECSPLVHRFEYFGACHDGGYGLLEDLGAEGTHLYDTVV